MNRTFYVVPMALSQEGEIIERVTVCEFCLESVESPLPDGIHPVEQDFGDDTCNECGYEHGEEED